MATQENRGGANGGSQYNPNKISPMGGNGQSGKKAQKAMQLRPSGGGEYGATKALTEQIQQGRGVRTTAPAAAGPMRIPASQLPPLTGITAPTQRPEEDITTGSLANPVGMMTPGPESLILPGGGVGDVKFDNNIKAYYPILAYISGRDDTSEDTRQVINTLMRAI
jgi:hypothetical protein